MPDESMALRNRPIFRILGGALVLVLLGLTVAILIGRNDGNNRNGSNGNQNANTSVPAFDARQGAIPVDTDKDGLTDSREAEAKTNPAVADTDQDGLSDFDEIGVYRSDPLKADSDGDGNNDGLEVSKGFSPTGAGRLFDTSSSATTNAAL